MYVCMHEGKHLSKDDPAVLEITDALVSALKTPSETVQKTVADCLSGLIQVIKANEHAGSIYLYNMIYVICL